MTQEHASQAELRSENMLRDKTTPQKRLQPVQSEHVPILFPDSPYLKDNMILKGFMVHTPSWGYDGKWYMAPTSWFIRS